MNNKTYRGFEEATAPFLRDFVVFVTTPDAIKKFGNIMFYNSVKTLPDGSFQFPNGEKYDTSVHGYPYFVIDNALGMR